MIHIVFNEADVSVLQKVIKLDETLAGNIFQIKDDYAVGPLQDCYIGTGIENRKQWWRNILLGSDYESKVDDGSIDDHKTIAEIVGTLRRNEDEIVWIWAAQNSHDVCGYYWLLHYLKEFAGRVHILYLNNLPFINEKGNIFYPTTLSQILPTEFLKAKKLAREITLSEFEVDPDEWQKLMIEGKGLRVLEGGKKLVQFDYDYYDSEIKKFITTGSQKVTKIMHQIFTKSKIPLSDVYVNWRIKMLIELNELIPTGEISNAKEFEVKLA